MTSRLSYLPSLSLDPQGTTSSFDKAKASWTYNVPVSASWEVDIFDRLTNAKRQAKAALSQSQAYSQAVQTQLIANIANLYYTLLMLDRQYEITTETAVKWLESLHTAQALMAGLPRRPYRKPRLLATPSRPLLKIWNRPSGRPRIRLPSYWERHLRILSEEGWKTNP